jgi:thioredoxin-like negative regulator of GroEL
MTNSKVLEAKLLIAPGCAHCPTVMQNLATLVKEGAIGKLEIVNIHQYPEIAQQLNVRSVPWLQLGELTFSGVYSLQELRNWTESANSQENISKYIEQQLADGQLSPLLEKIKRYPHWLSAIIQLLENDDTSMQVRLGIDSLVESLAGTAALQSHVNELGKLSQKIHPSRLADIIYYLGLSQSPSAVPFIEAQLENENPDIREICSESLEEINANN